MGQMKIVNRDLIFPNGGKFRMQKNDCGYWYIRKDKKTIQVSRLMHDYHVFNSNGHGSIEIIDGNKDNLHPSNLRLASQSWLSKKAARNNHFKGRAISHSKVDAVKKDKRPKAEIAREYGVTPRTIRRNNEGS